MFLLMAAALYGPVCYAGIAHPGHSYSMSDSYWVNSGTEPETIVIHVDPPAGEYWIRMKEDSIMLNPGQAASIPVTLYIPPGAAKGIYGARLVASSGAEENVLFGVGVKADCTGGSPVVRKKENSGRIIPLGIVGGLLITVLIGLRIMPRRSNCDHPVHRPRRNKWQSLTLWGALQAQARSRLRPPPAARPMRAARVRPGRGHVHDDACRCDGTRKTIAGWEHQFAAALGHLRTAWAALAGAERNTAATRTRQTARQVQNLLPRLHAAGAGGRAAPCSWSSWTPGTAQPH